MAARPPQNDLDDGPDTVAFGIAALAERLDAADVTYPTDVETLDRELGDAEVPYNASGATMTVGEALDAVPKQRFESERELLNVLHPVFEEKRASASRGLLARIRSFIPI